MKNLKNGITIVLITICSIAGYAQSNAGLAGEYIVGEQNTIVKIEQQDAVYSGTIMSSDNSKVKIGKLMVKDLEQTRGKWKGKVYAPKRKEWYDAEFILKENTLDIKIKVGFFSKTIEWLRK
ncbi:DUF2147 domain-containing protein [Tenacibaculum insulae]|uniref:DUF2147 domain-containing protein n=1 Tax=Tenacibaculum insulae TaxID=2029677 RepID=UPI003AB65772